jgi:hypothetical protein
MAGLPSYGTTLDIGGAVAGVKSIDGPSLSREAIDVTSLTDSHKTKIVSRPNGGTVTAELLFDDTHYALLASLDATVTTADVPTPTACTITFPSGSFSFDAYITGFQAKASGDDALTATITLEITGPVTSAAAGA